MVNRCPKSATDVLRFLLKEELKELKKKQEAAAQETDEAKALRLAKQKAANEKRKATIASKKLLQQQTADSNAAEITENIAVAQADYSENIQNDAAAAAAAAYALSVTSPNIVIPMPSTSNTASTSSNSSKLTHQNSSHGEFWYLCEMLLYIILLIILLVVVGNLFEENSNSDENEDDVDKIIAINFPRRKQKNKLIGKRSFSVDQSNELQTFDQSLTLVVTEDVERLQKAFSDFQASVFTKHNIEISTPFS